MIASYWRRTYKGSNGEAFTSKITRLWVNMAAALARTPLESALASLEQICPFRRSVRKMPLSLLPNAPRRKSSRTGTWDCVIDETEFTPSKRFRHLLHLFRNPIDDPCNLIGYQQCDLFPNRTIFCSKFYHFPSQWEMNTKTKQLIRFQGLFKVTNQIAGK